MRAEGHEVGNHSHTHADLGTEPWRAAEELERASGAIALALGRRPALFRPPLGAWTSDVLAEARRKGMRTVLWDVNPHDYAGGGRAAAEIADEVLRAARRGSIVLLHDGGEAEHRGPLLEALPALVEGLRARFELVTVPRLLGEEVEPAPSGLDPGAEQPVD